MTVVALHNLKGGVGKTTTTAALGEFLAAEFGQRVLLIDLDPQTNLTTMMIGEQRWQQRDRRRCATMRDSFLLIRALRIGSKRWPPTGWGGRSKSNSSPAPGSRFPSISGRASGSACRPVDFAS